MTKGTKIKELLIEGKNYGEIIREVGCAGSTIAYHAKQIGKQQYTFTRKNRDWEAIQEYYNEGYTLKEVCKKFDISDSSIRYAMDKKWFATASDYARRQSLLKKQQELAEEGVYRKRMIKSMEEVLVENSYYSRADLKKRLVSEGIKRYACEGKDCPLFSIEQPSWAGKSITLHIDHLNGVSIDNRLENLRFLCPNCHSQTETYCGKNRLTQKNNKV